ncbi:DNA topoisomerase III [Acidaminobacter sp. JC074]|uniref:DNA topoisomerase III n=1 Tax=Acidaminobacter sp. JC074 TaxID=2530199 RepID=UPI001F0CEF3C|nr:DNA topoisomerase III [Acidaminobacter sp. JC074]MCH4889806.1 DNA topoisomerase III [Acidaminobacter sp. JC074]
MNLKTKTTINKDKEILVPKFKKALVLAEKPSVGREIARVLGCTKKHHAYIEGNKYIVTWALGHLVTLADPDVYDKKYANWHLEDLPILPDHLKTVVMRKTSKQFNVVKQQLNRQDVKEVIIATDAGREGELVARWIISKSKVKKPIKRLWISSVTDKAIKDGFNHLHDGRKYENLYRSAIARAEGDWLVGINATRALTTKYNTSLSCGRVQTPTLSMIHEREKQIVSFRPKKYYGLDLDASNLKFTWYQDKHTRFYDLDFVKNIEKDLKSKEAIVTSVSKKGKKTYAPHLYDLTELQRDAYKKFSYSPKKTLGLMQRLYEHHKALTYPRTDSRFLTDDIVATIKDRLRSISIQPYRGHAFKLSKEAIKAGKHYVDNKKVTDHHAIIPTEEMVNVQDMSYEERNIYELVVKRFLEVLMPPYRYEETVVEVLVNKETFRCKFNNPLQLGFKELSADQEKKQMTHLKKGDHLDIKQYTLTKGETSPPAYFNEASLLSAMENPVAFMAEGEKNLKSTLQKTGGLGTVATRADIIEKLFNNELIETKKNGIHITSKGKQLLNVAPTELKSPALTAEWEVKLESISKGTMKYTDFIDEMRSYTKTIIHDINASGIKFKHDNITSTKCPECGKLMMKKKTKHGESLVCQDRNCNHRISISKVTNARCPECHKKMELRGSDDKKIFVCKCGYKEKLTSFEKRKKESGKSGGKRDYMKYKKEQEKMAKENTNNPFSKLKNLDLK